MAKILDQDSLVRSSSLSELGNANGEISFPFPAKVAAGNYTYDVQVTYSNGEIQTFIKDKLKILYDVTV